MEFCTKAKNNDAKEDINGIGIYSQLPSFECYVHITFVITYSLVAIVALILYLIYRREASRNK